MIQMNCTQCNGVFNVDTSQGHAYVKCPHCSAANAVGATNPVGTANAVRAANPVQPQEVSLAQFQEPEPSRGVPWLWIILGVAGLFMMLLFAGGIFALYMLSSGPQLADQRQDADWNIAAEQIDEPEPQRSRPNKWTATPNPNRNTNKQSKNQSAFRYNFDKGHQYQYQFSVESSMNKQDVSLTGTISYSDASTDGTIDRKLKQGLPDQVKQMPNLMQIASNVVFSQRTGTKYGSPSNKISNLLCDDTGQIHRTSLQYGDKGDSDLLPIIFTSPDQIALVDFPDDGSRNWQETASIQLVNVSTTESKAPQTSIERILNRQRSHYPSPYGPGGYPSLPSRSPYTPPYSPYARYNPYGRRVTEKKPVEVELMTIAIDTVTDYKFQSENDSTLVLQRTIKGTPADSSDMKIRLNRTETITFDKKQNVISKIESEGDTQIVVENITITLPIDYTVDLKEVLTPADLAEKKRERDKRYAKSRAESKARSDKHAAERAAKKRKTDAAKLAAKEAASKYEHADFGKVSWGLKSMAFTPNGRFLICGHMDNKISVFDTQRKRRVEFLDDLDQLGQVVCTTVSPDGKYVLTGGYSGRIQVWKIDDSGLLDNVGQFVGHTSEIKSIAIDPAGKMVLSGESDDIARLWNLKTQKEVQAIREFESSVDGTGFTEGGKIGVATDRENMIYINAATGEIDRKRKGYRSGSAHDIAFSPDGTEFVVADGYNLQIYETDTASKTKTIDGESINWKVAYLPDGKHIISGEKAICIWSVESEGKVHEINVGEHVNVQAIAASPDGRFVVGNCRPQKMYNNPLFGTSDFSIKKVEVASSTTEAADPAPKDAVEPEVSGLPKVHCQFAEQGWGIDALCFSPDGKYLYAGKYGMKVYDVERKRTIDNHDRFKGGSVTAIQAAADGKHVLTALNSGAILVWETDSRGQLTQIGKFEGHSSAVKAITIGPNSKWVVSGESKRARVWDLKTQKESLAVEFERQVSSCQILPNGRAVVMSDGEGVTVLKIPEMETWKKFDKVGQGYGRNSAVSLDGRKLATANSAKIELYDSTTGDNLSTLDAGETVWTLAFHPDGKHLLAGGRGKVMIWDTEKQTKVAELDVPSYYIQCIAISKDGKRIAAIPGSAGQTLTVFNSPIE